MLSRRAACLPTYLQTSEGSYTSGGRALLRRVERHSQQARLSTTTIPFHSKPVARPSAPRRFMSQSTYVRPTADLPPLPPAPPYPCPFLTDEEIHTYLVPLYARAWSVHRSDPGPKNKPAPELVKRFAFSDLNGLEAFLRDLEDITQTENHHGVLERSSQPPSVVVRVHTHSGLRPARYAEEPRRGRVQPGVTLRDVRYTYLLEERFVDYVRRGGEAERTSMLNKGSVAEQPLTAEALESRRDSSGETRS